MVNHATASVLMILASVVLGATSFMATNIDNLVLLIGFLSGQPGRSRAVIGGFLLSFVVLMVAASGLGLAADAVPVEHLRWLGLVPLGMGLRLMWRGWRQQAPEVVVASKQRGVGALGVAGVSLANGGDTLAAFGALLGEGADGSLLPVVFGASLLALLWPLLALLLVGRAGWSERLGDLAERWLPWGLVFIGLYVLADTQTDVVVAWLGPRIKPLGQFLLG